MTKCKVCVFWGVPKNNMYNWSKDIKGFGCCGSGKFIYTLDMPKEGDIPIDAVGFTDGETCQADLWTGAEFGCIHGRPMLVSNSGKSE